MTSSELTNRRAIQELALALGIDEPYNARIVGRRVEFHLRTRIVVRQLVTEPESDAGQKGAAPDLLEMSKVDLVKLATHLDIPRRSTMTKTQLIQAINEVQTR